METELRKILIDNGMIETEHHNKAIHEILLLFGVSKRTTCPKIKTCKVTPQHCACDMRNEYVC